MAYAFNRRQFLAGASCMAVGSALMDPAAAIEPIARPGTPKFKFSLAAYSYRDLLKGNPATLTLADFVRDCAEMNLEGTELTSYYFPEPLTDEYLCGLKRQCFELGLDVSGGAVGNDFGYPPGPKRDEQLALVKRWVDHAELLGAPVIRIFAGLQKPGVEPRQTHSLMVSGIEECCDYAGKHGVFLALENHGGPTTTAQGMLSFIRDVRSPWLGVNLDTGNFFTDDPYDDIEQIAPYAVNVQAKAVVSKPEGENKRPTDFPRVAGILRKAGYRGYIVLEYEEGGDPRVECRKYIDVLREAFA